MTKKMLLKELNELATLLNMPNQELVQKYNLDSAEYLDSFRVGWTMGTVRWLINVIETGYDE